MGFHQHKPDMENIKLFDWESWWFNRSVRDTFDICSWFPYLRQDKCQHQELVLLLSVPGQMLTPGARGSPIWARTNINTISWFSYLNQDKYQHQLLVSLSQPGHISTPASGFHISARTNINTSPWFPYLNQDKCQHQLLVSLSEPGQIPTPASGSPIWTIYCVFRHVGVLTPIIFLGHVGFLAHICFWPVGFKTSLCL